MGASGEEMLPFNQRQIKQPKFVYFPLRKSFEKQTEKQVDAMLSINPSTKLKQIEGIFSQNWRMILICTKLEKIVELQDII